MPPNAKQTFPYWKGLILCGLMLACTTPMHERFLQEINVGDPASKLLEKFGKPYSFTPYGDMALAQYLKDGAICGAVIKNGIVSERTCDTTYYNSPWQQFGAALQGAGQGLVHAQDNSYSCTDNGGGYYICWYQGRAYNCTVFGSQMECR